MVHAHHTRKKKKAKLFYYVESPWRQGRRLRLCKVNCARVHVQGVPLHKSMTVPWCKLWEQMSLTVLGWNRISTSLCGSFWLHPWSLLPPELLAWISGVAVYTLPWPLPSWAPSSCRAQWQKVLQDLLPFSKAINPIKHNESQRCGGRWEEAKKRKQRKNPTRPFQRVQLKKKYILWITRSSLSPP